MNLLNEMVKSGFELMAEEEIRVIAESRDEVFIITTMYLYRCRRSHHNDIKFVIERVSPL